MVITVVITLHEHDGGRATTARRTTTTSFRLPSPGPTTCCPATCNGKTSNQHDSSTTTTAARAATEDHCPSPASRTTTSARAATENHRISPASRYIDNQVKTTVYLTLVALTSCRTPTETIVLTTACSTANPGTTDLPTANCAATRAIVRASACHPTTNRIR